MHYELFEFYTKIQNCHGAVDGIKLKTQQNSCYFGIFKLLLTLDWPSGLRGHHAAFYCLNCCGYESHMGRHFEWSIKCCSEYEYYLCPFMYVCEVPRDTTCTFILREL